MRWTSGIGKMTVDKPAEQACRFPQNLHPRLRIYRRLFSTVGNTGLIGKAIPWFTRVLYKCGNRVLANTLVMGVVHQPMRGMSRFSQGGLRMSQLDGLISMFNGHFFSGLHHFFKEGRKYKRLAKAEKKAQKEAEKAKEI